jgi:ligand-binding sensor protein
MKLTEIYPIEKWTAFEEKINDLSGMDANVFNTDGIRITNHKKWVNRLCPAIKAIDKGQSYICAVAHMNIASQAMQTHQAVIEECDAGLIKLVVPIFYKDEFVGAVGACGLLTEDGEVDAFLINKTTDMDEALIETLSEGIGTLSRQKADALIEFIRKELQQILSPSA